MSLSIQFANIFFAVGLFVNAALFVPQILILLRTKHSDEISPITFIGFCFIQIFTIIHGLITKDIILIIGYVLSLITCGTVTVLIINYRIRGNQNEKNSA